ncbi:hypothetical protein SESBI_13446 [Sesbania bispinosa]|nr:hypothetical protein SESBI_39057 [Sesbania bispinosa]KAJ1421808.1 hypothetical protein SESBI_13446 [Sesbania bispinosa]
MTENSSKGYQQKQEGDGVKIKNFSKAPSRQWSLYRNPRIVRVSRSMGGKDRHSKVCTISGLKDRRIRLSVPTALELYDLQDKLGLSQPSKVVDWLLEVTKYEIDKLPPLQIPQCFTQFHHQTLLPHHHEAGTFKLSLAGLRDVSSISTKDAGNQNLMAMSRYWDIDSVSNSTFMKDVGNQNLMAKSRYWDIGSVSKLKGKEAESDSISGKGKCWIKANEQENQGSAHKLFPIGTDNPSLSGLLNNSMTYNPYQTSCLSLSQFGRHGLFTSQVDSHPSSGSAVQFSSSVSVPSNSQLLFYPSSAMSSLFTPHTPFMVNSMESSQVMPHPLIPPLHPINSPFRLIPTPFSSKPLASVNNNNPN